MARNSWTAWIVCMWVFMQSVESATERNNDEDDHPCVPKSQATRSIQNTAYLVKTTVNQSLIIVDNFYQDGEEPRSGIFVQNMATVPKFPKWKWPQIDWNGFVLHLTKWHTKKKKKIYVMRGGNCSEAVNQINESCTMKCVETNKVCRNAIYNENLCNQSNSQGSSTYFVKVTENTCINCNNPVKPPEVEVDLNKEIPDLPPLPTSPEEPLDPEAANKVVSSMTSDFVAQFNESTVALTMSDSISGVLVKQADPLDLEEVSLGFSSAKLGFSVLEDRNTLSEFSRSFTVSKEAFEMSKSFNVSEPFAAVFSFLNMSKDENQSSVLGDEVIAIEMGAKIRNLTDTISINFFNGNYEGVPSCHSWNGDGRWPVWTSDGCETVTEGINITCRCTHLTFFAVLLTPLDETVSTNDLNTLATITRVGCGISMFFLGIVLFMHFLWRRTKSSDSTKILIHLVLAMFLLSFSFLINDSVAQTKNEIGCKIMAAAMHYFMLSTFTWFAVHAFHLSFQLYKRGKIEIRHYVLKVCIVSWVMPSVIGIVLLSIGKYGEVAINTEDPATSVAMCWILDVNVHYIVNTSYYALVFLFTFSVFILMLTWLCHMSRVQSGQGGSSGQKIVTMMGLCCILGVTWGCAFFAYGVFRVPAYYCFTILNSFQGFGLSIYYYKTSSMKTKDALNSSTEQNTIKTNLDVIYNPYQNNTPNSE